MGTFTVKVVIKTEGTCNDLLLLVIYLCVAPLCFVEQEPMEGCCGGSGTYSNRVNVLRKHIYSEILHNSVIYFSAHRLVNSLIP